MPYHGASIQWEARAEVQQRVLQVLSNELFIKPRLSLLRRHPLNCEESKWRRAYALPWIRKREELRIPHKDRLPIPHPRMLLLSQAFRVPNIQPSLWPLPTFKHSIPCPPISTTEALLFRGRGDRFRSRFTGEDNVTQTCLVDGPPANRGCCPAADFGKPSCDHKGHRRENLRL